MRIMRAYIFVCCLIVTTLAVDEHRPKRKDDRGKRNLEYQVSHHYSALPSYRLERRISTGSQYQIPSQYFPRPYRKDTHNDDPLTENNQVQDNVDRYGYHKPRIIERPVYIKEPEPIIEIIIKESNVSLPAPPPPPPPPKKKKEEVQVFYVKYEKNPHGTGKNSIIYDKPVPAISPKLPDREEEEHAEEASYNYHSESATVVPPPSTTLRTVIRPDSETYHSPSGVKVTFGKEGFDYDKRSPKPEDFQPPPSSQLPQGRQLSSFSNTYFKRPATSQNYQTLPPGFRSDVRPPQSYRPFTFSSPSNFKTFGRQSAPSQYQQQAQQPSKYSFQSPPFPKPNQQFNSFSSQSPHFSHTISHPPPPRFQSPRPTAPQGRQPVPYKPFENLRPQQTFSQPAVDNLKHQQTFSQPAVDNLRNQQTFSQPSVDTLRSQQTFSQPPPVSSPLTQHHIHRPEAHFPVHQQLPLTEQTHTFNKPRFSQPIESQFNNVESPHKPVLQHSTQYNPPQALQQLPNQQLHQNFLKQQTSNHQQNVLQQNLQQQLQGNFNQQNQNYQHQQTLYHNQINHNQQQQSVSQNEHLSEIQGSILPAGGQLIPSVSKYEQHISSVEPATHGQSTQQSSQQLSPHRQPQNTSPQQYQQVSSDYQQTRNFPQQYHQHASSHEQSQILSPQQYQQKTIQQFNSNGNSRGQGSREVSIRQQSIQDQQEEQLRHFYQQNPDIKQKNQFGFGSTTPNPSEYQATRKASESASSTPRISYQSTTSKPSSTTTEEVATPSTTTKDPKILEAQLPDEVPEELRQQLLSSGILNNADISILDYDKVGDIPLSALPPDQLANFYSAGGAAQIGSGSDPVPSVVQRDGTKVEERLIEDEDELEPAASDIQEVSALPQGPPSAVDLKVVHYDPDTDSGQQVQQKYVEDEATQVNPVVLNDSSYNRYLPLKVNGTQFPIPDVPELKGKKISSVVVLAPVTYDFSSDRKTRQTTRELSQKSTDIQLIEGIALKDLLANPTQENYKKFLESERNSKSDKQSVILLVTDPSEGNIKEREIFMYDVVSQNVTKLSGELSSAFVEAAEANSEDNVEETAASNVIETRVSFTGKVDRQGYLEEDLEDSASEIEESKIPVIDPLQDEVMETESSENLERFVDISDHPLEDFAVSSSNSLLKTEYTKTGNS
ncbi:uncharacterized protein isoform X2 [Leptinotarsa decemlineata]|uniref:uncharacterized protein isoform X2 n=1 Tax=Leptinotarsa decemlineata TaxID=7539 RepID=UPI003D30A556